MPYIIVFMTTSNKQEATNVVRTLLEERLIACANIVDTVTSVFWWKEKIEQENETLVIMKSEQKLFEKLSSRIKMLHSYEVPEVLAVPITDGSQSYLDWMKSFLESGK